MLPKVEVGGAHPVVRLSVIRIDAEGFLAGGDGIHKPACYKMICGLSIVEILFWQQGLVESSTAFNQLLHYLLNLRSLDGVDITSRDNVDYPRSKEEPRQSRKPESPNVPPIGSHDDCDNAENHKVDN